MEFWKQRKKELVESIQNKDDGDASQFIDGILSKKWDANGILLDDRKLIGKIDNPNYGKPILADDSYLIDYNKEISYKLSIIKKLSDELLEIQDRYEKRKYLENIPDDIKNMLNLTKNMIHSLINDIKSKSEILDMFLVDNDE